MSICNKSLFISFEGIDGCGKSTVVKLLADYLKNKKIPNIITREPGSSLNPLSEEIRNILLDNKFDVDPITESLLFAASRSANVEQVISKNLNKKKIIVTDRYIDSSLVYQGMWRNIGVDKILNINLLAVRNILPDITFLLDIKPELAMKRINKSKRKCDRLDNEIIGNYDLVYQGYNFLANKFKNRYIRIDASKTPNEIITDILNHINLFLKKGKYFTNEI